MESSTSFTSLQYQAFTCLKMTNPSQKVQAVHQLFNKAMEQTVILDSDSLDLDESCIPGRPSQPELVDPLSVKRRAMHTIEGRATAIHALAHIEFNAINLALDAIWRFSEMPGKYYLDWLKVAKEESYHFSLLNDHLRSLGYQYGDFPAHNSLWEMVEKTKGDVLARMALVPRTMEARGLDAVPAMRERFLQAKDFGLVEILDIILHDEITHVAIGNHWFNYVCGERGVDPIQSFSSLCKTYNAPTLRGPFNMEARRMAGFSENELKQLENEARKN